MATQHADSYKAKPQAAITLTQAETPQHIAQARELFLEYAESLGFSLCFQGFEQELAGLPGDYTPPQGRLLLAFRGAEAVGCVALHAFHGEGSDGSAGVICEMKRLYVRPQYRGLGAGQMLTHAVMEAARQIGYRTMRLDSVAGKMDSAITMYRALGFREIPPYRENPIPGALYLELDL